MMKTLLAILLLSALSFGQTTATQDADALEAQYKTCAKHSIPADKCTPEIYQQLKAKDDAPLDPTTATALKAVKEYQSSLKNPDSMQVHTAYVTDNGDVCLEIGGQNGLGGISVSRIVYTSKGRWLPDGFRAALMNNQGDSSYQVDRWRDRIRDNSGHWRWVCQTMTKGLFARPGEMQPGTDVTDKVNEALKRAKQ
jgi:hypothetical protein